MAFQIPDGSAGSEIDLGLLSRRRFEAVDAAGMALEKLSDKPFYRLVGPDKTMLKLHILIKLIMMAPFEPTGDSNRTVINTWRHL